MPDGIVLYSGEEALTGMQLAGAVIGVRGALPTHIGALTYDLFTGTSIYKPDGFDRVRVALAFQAMVRF
ncbi:hypothetical protein [Paraburkholderia ferrariae]|uniref:hypothetical protein n=1 Tax=Paraburkholderia ferrariae TaxID=386056 RepID=UPI0012EB6F18|nr:hypothetical protein [Paraburkholderia ferrariae]